jgi:hypothetical protein
MRAKGADINDRRINIPTDTGGRNRIFMDIQPDKNNGIV